MSAQANYDEKREIIRRLIDSHMNPDVARLGRLLEKAYDAGRARGYDSGLSAGRLSSGAPSYLHCDHERPWWECPSHDRGFIAIFHAQRDRDARRGDR